MITRRFTPAQLACGPEAGLTLPPDGDLCLEDGAPAQVCPNCGTTIIGSRARPRTAYCMLCQEVEMDAYIAALEERVRTAEAARDEIIADWHCNFEQYQEQLNITSVLCPVCRGTGAWPGSDTVHWLPCQRCEGKGRLPNDDHPSDHGL